MNKKAYAIDAENIYDLEDKINKFGENYEIVATQIYQTQMGYDALIWYTPKKAENPLPEKEEKKFEPATEKQQNYLKQLGYDGDIKRLTKREANVLISELRQKPKLKN